MRLLNQILNEGPFNYWEHAIYLGYRGSIAHGTFVPGSNPSGIDDRDVFGIIIPPANIFFGLGNFEQYETKQGEWDVLLYDFRKFIRLLIKSNPNVMQALWTPEEHHLKVTPFFSILQKNKHLFAHRGIYQSYCGYSQSQLHKMEHMACEGYMGEKRKALVEKYGYDCKNAAHLIRLLRQGTEFLKTGELVVTRPDRDELIAIKTGQWPLEKVKKTAQQLFVDMQDAYDASTLPDNPDMSGIDKLVQSILMDYYV